MIPLILVEKDKKRIESEIESIIKIHNIPQYNITRVFPQKKEISIEQIRLIKKETYINYASLRLFILNEFHTASIEAQNAFLKTLEEQTAKILFILITENEHSILPTILSRAKVFSLTKSGIVYSSTPEIDELIKKIQESESYGFLSQKNIECATREQSIVLLDSLLAYFRLNLAANSTEAVPMLKKILSYRSLLRYNNLQPQIAIDTLLIFLKKTVSMK